MGSLTSITAKAKDNKRGMTREEIADLLDRFSGHMCLGVESHPVTARTGFRSQIIEMTLTCTSEE